MTEATAVAADDEIEELLWYLERTTPHVGYFGQDVSCFGDVYRIVNEDNGEFVAHFKSKDDAMFFFYSRTVVPKLLAARGAALKVENTIEIPGADVE